MLKLLAIVFLSLSIDSTTAYVDSLTNANIHKSNLKDTVTVQVVNHHEETFLVKYQSFIGSFLAALIAIFSILATHKLAARREQEKVLQENDRRRSNYLITIRTVIAVLSDHKHITPQMQAQLDSILSESIKHKKLVVSDSGLRISVDFLTDRVRQFLAFEGNNATIATRLVLYLHAAERFNSFANLSQAIELQNFYPDSEAFTQGLTGYLTNLKDRLNRLQTVSQEIIDLLNGELQQNQKNES